METYVCQECGKTVTAAELHTYLHCELYKLGHRDPNAYLASYGYERVKDEVVADA
jgi:DNA-directed RNA polymerase subunit RPC12/RpoP